MAAAAPGIKSGFEVGRRRQAPCWLTLVPTHSLPRELSPQVCLLSCWPEGVSWTLCAGGMETCRETEGSGARGWALLARMAALGALRRVSLSHRWREGWRREVRAGPRRAGPLRAAAVAGGGGGTSTSETSPQMFLAPQTVALGVDIGFGWLCVHVCVHVFTRMCVHMYARPHACALDSVHWTIGRIKSKHTEQIDKYAHHPDWGTFTCALVGVRGPRPLPLPLPALPPAPLAGSAEPGTTAVGGGGGRSAERA